MIIASVLLFVFVGVSQAAETGEFKSFYIMSDDTFMVACSTYWPDIDSSEDVLELHPLWGPPTGIISTTFYDNADDGQGLTAATAGERVFIDPDDYEAADLSDGQITIYRTEVDGTVDGLTTSVWTLDILYWIRDPDWCGS